MIITRNTQPSQFYSGSAPEQAALRTTASFKLRLRPVHII